MHARMEPTNEETVAYIWLSYRQRVERLQCSLVELFLDFSYSQMRPDIKGHGLGMPGQNRTLLTEYLCRNLQPTFTRASLSVLYIGATFRVSCW